MEVRPADTISSRSAGPFGAGALHQDFSYYAGLKDTELWDCFRNGDASAFAFIYVSYFQVLFSYGRQFTRDAELVKDVIQDLFIYLQEKKAGLSAIASIKFYLYKSYRNRMIRYLNRNKTGWQLLTGENEEGFEIALADISGEDDSPLNDVLKEKMEHAFSALTRRQREIIIYYFYEGFSYQEITALMGFAKVDYARILMSRSILKLRQELGASGMTPELALLLLLLNR